LQQQQAQAIQQQQQQMQYQTAANNLVQQAQTQLLQAQF